MQICSGYSDRVENFAPSLMIDCFSDPTGYFKADKLHIPKCDFNQMLCGFSVSKKDEAKSH